MTIKIVDVACNIISTKEFKIQIEYLLQNIFIIPSFKSHGSLAFLVKNHNEEKQGKSMIVINYKRLNDKTYDGAFKISNKDF